MDKQLNLLNLEATPIKDILNFNKKTSFQKGLSVESHNLSLSTFKIETQYKKLRVELNNLKVKFFDVDPWLTKEELDILMNQKYNDSLTLKELSFNISKFTDFIEEIRENSLYQIVKDKKEIDSSNDILKKNTLDEKYLQKMILNQVSQEIFNKKSGLKIKIIEKKEQFPETNKHSFVYFSAIPLEEFKTNKYLFIVDANGKKIELEKFYQSNENFYIQTKVKDHSIKLTTTIYYGMIICKN